MDDALRPYVHPTACSHLPIHSRTHSIEIIEMPHIRTVYRNHHTIRYDSTGSLQIWLGPQTGRVTTVHMQAL